MNSYKFGKPAFTWETKYSMFNNLGKTYYPVLLVITFESVEGYVQKTQEKTSFSSPRDF